MTLSFFQNLGPCGLDAILAIIDCKPYNLNNDDFFESLDGLKNQKKNSLIFIYDKETISNRYFPNSTIICTKKKSTEFDKKQKMIIVKDVQLSLAKISNLFYRDLTKKEINSLNNPIIGRDCNISDNVILENGVIIGNNVTINDGAIIKHSCAIGDNSYIDSNSVISNSVFGESVNVGRNCSIGQQGFGFAIDTTKNIRIFHVGRVVLKAKVNIGSNCSIDRGSFSDTVIGENTYLDNLCHIAHNVEIGSNSIFAAMSGIAGSANIGNNVMAGGQTGVAGHINVGDNVRIAAKSGVFSDVKSNQSIMGNPAINMFTFLKKYKKSYGS